MALSNNSVEIQKLYVAYFNRPADVLGLQYWDGVVAAAGGGTAALSTALAASAEYRQIYAGLDNYHAVAIIYQNLFGHPADAAGLSYWGNALSSGAIELGQVATAIAAGAQGTDATAYHNKVAVAMSFTAQLDTDLEIRAYAGPDAMRSGKLFMSGITTDDSVSSALAPAALKQTVADMVDATSAPVGGPSSGLTNYAVEIQKLYLTYTGRPADVAGMQYWEGVVAAANGSTAAVSKAFAASAEFQAATAQLDAYHVVATAYIQLFGHQPDVAGLNYWGTALISGRYSVDTVMTSIAAAAQGGDLTAYVNKVTAAGAFTGALDTTSFVLGYSGENSNNVGKNFLSGITSDATLAAVLAPAALRIEVGNIFIRGGPIPASAPAHAASSLEGQGAPLDAAAVTLVGVAAHDGGAPHAL